MDIEQEKLRIKKWIAGYLAAGLITLLIGLSNPWFLILTAIFLFIASRMFKDINKLDEEYEPNITKVQEVVTDNLETKQINTEVKMEKTNEEKELLLEVLSKDEELNAFLKVTNGQAKFALFEKLRAELEAKAKKKAEPVKETKEEQKPVDEEEDVIVED